MDKEMSTNYVAKKGESLYLIARSRGLDPKALAQLNPSFKSTTEEIEGQSVVLPLGHVPKCPNGFLYTIKAGDTYWQLAQRFGTTVEAIQMANPGVNPNNLQIGQVICIPTKKPAPKCPNGFLYTIKAGDTYWILAQRYGTTVDAIIKANPGVDPNNLQIGQVICIPTGKKPPVTKCPNGFLYTIKAGDTFWILAHRYGTTVEAIKKANPGVDPNNLQIGQVICIPVKPVEAPPCSGFYYSIAPGDTFFILAQRFDTTVSALEQANPGVNPNNLQIGQIICIPVAAPIPCPGGFFYTIQPGDTFFLIAQRFGTSVNALEQANPGMDPLNLPVGGLLCIPVAP